jgi:hypothetical protein
MESKMKKILKTKALKGAIPNKIKGNRGKENMTTAAVQVDAIYEAIKKMTESRERQGQASFEVLSSGRITREYREAAKDAQGELCAVSASLTNQIR